ncbi:MAG TPA: nucleoside hydrolase [Patescibacteria group bacterium]|nr:nucleoside hydrolase [Patescibacteria group bacterium]
MKRKIILICDTKNEIDDQFAIAYALKSPEINLLGIVASQNNRKQGKKSLETNYLEAKNIIKLAKAKIPVFRGANSPLNLADKPKNSEGLIFIIREITKNPQKIDLVCTGPATELASLILKRPDLVKKCRMIWLGGFKNQKEAEKFKCREENFLGDIKAAKILFETEANLIIIPAWGTADDLVLQSKNLSEELKSQKSPLANYLGEIIDNNWTKPKIISKILPHVLKRFWVFFDLAAVAVSKNYGIVSQQKIPAPKIRKNQFIFPKNNKFKITIIDKIDAPAILTQVKKYLLGGN